MRIISAASAFPENYYTQRELIDAFLLHWGPLVSDTRKLELLHHNVGVDGRYLARPIEQYVNLKFGDANNIWIETAQRLGAEAVSKALALAGIPPERPGAIIFVSVTGISSPSIDALLVNRLGLSPHIRRTPIFGLGCVAGAAGLARAADYVKAYPDQYVILLSVELCSLTLQRDDISPANLISTGLFGDGAAAVIIAGDACPESPQRGLEIIDTSPTFYPDTEDVMGWAISERGFRIVLSPAVPEVISANVGKDLDTLLTRNNLTRSDIQSWILHTGGPKILRGTQQALGITETELAASWACLRRMGNLSSSSVLMVLEETMLNRRPVPGTWSILGAMGPGFCSELLLLRW